jgi:hypothetical protein
MLRQVRRRESNPERPSIALDAHIPMSPPIFTTFIGICASAVND